MHARMAVIDLEKLFASDPHHVFRRHRIAEIRVIEVNHHRLAGAFALGDQGAHVILNRIRHAFAFHRNNQFLEVRGIEVDREPLETVGNLLALDEQILSGFGEFFFDLVKAFQADFQPAISFALVHPVFAEFLDQLLVGLAFALVLFHIGPAFLVVQHVMIGEGQEVIPSLLVPGGDHFGIIVAIAPEGMRMDIAPIPLQRTLGFERLSA